ncbi:hypothetical protein ACFQDG_10265 [Natronoarchaeum mannanilyticum]|uniref:Uncharacterized protein n=1 Tax=Natronoarchaeum mannanilyticum TaxID=926360 RepID=A0AAV3T9Z5_9EURY
MTDEVTVHVNRTRRHAIAVADDPFVTAGSFDVVLVNHGEGAHVHLGLDGDLAAAGEVEASAPFLDADTTERVAVRVNARGPVGGALTLSAGYGKSSIEVPVRIDPDAGPDVDAAPERTAASTSLPSFVEPLVDRLSTVDGVDATDPATLGLIALAGGALLVAALVASLVDSGVVFAGVLVVVAAVAGALSLLLLRS